MNRSFGIALNCMTATMLLASVARGQSYMGVVLYEVDFLVEAVYGGQTVGWDNYGSSDTFDPIDPVLANAPDGEVVYLSPPALRMFNRTRV